MDVATMALERRVMKEAREDMAWRSEGVAGVGDG